ncbi:MAG TPA: hypothetical protein VFM06_05680 [Candidatus Limnocylindria bacterium]|nr:hypothetical protein [Candidatus Limnocylindria bacterium]
MRRLLATGVATLAILLATTTVVTATHSWSTYHWARGANPLALSLGDNLTPDWDGYLVTASADWSLSTVLETTIVAGSTTGRKCKPSAGNVQVCNAAYGRNGWLGLAQIWISGGHITQGVAKMNDTYFKMDRYNNTSEKLHVVCQEIAHTFGLGHQDESGISLDTCMDYYHNTSDADTQSTRPNAHDYEQLELIYGSHTDGAASAAFSPLTALGAAEDGTPHGASRARGSWYAQDLGNGRFLLTHVFWAPFGH